MLDESPAWLLTLLRAEARAQVLAGDINLATTAATVTKEGGRLWPKLAGELRRSYGD